MSEKNKKPGGSLHIKRKKTKKLISVQEEARERDRQHREKLRKAAGKRKRQLTIRIVLLVIAVIAIIVGIARFTSYRKQQQLEPEGGIGTNILRAAEDELQQENGTADPAAGSESQQENADEDPAAVSEPQQ